VYELLTLIESKCQAQPTKSVLESDLPQTDRDKDALTLIKAHRLVDQSFVPPDAPNLARDGPGWRVCLNEAGRTALARWRLSDAGFPTVYTANLAEPWTDRGEFVEFSTVMYAFAFHRKSFRQLQQEWNARMSEAGRPRASMLFHPVMKSFFEVIKPYHLFVQRWLDRIVRDFPNQLENIASIQSSVATIHDDPTLALDNDPNEIPFDQFGVLVRSLYRERGIPVGTMTRRALANGTSQWHWRWADETDSSMTKGSAGKQRPISIFDWKAPKSYIGAKTIASEFRVPRSTLHDWMDADQPKVLTHPRTGEKYFQQSWIEKRLARWHRDKTVPIAKRKPRP